MDRWIAPDIGGVLEGTLYVVGNVETLKMNGKNTVGMKETEICYIKPTSGVRLLHHVYKVCIPSLPRLHQR